MKKFWKTLMLLILVIGLIFGGLFLFYGKKEAEEMQAYASLESLVQKTTSRADYVPYENISPFLLEATVSVEDARFYRHGALDLIGMARGILSQFIPGMNKSGGSSITQQVVKNLYQRFNGGLEWKAAEIRLAFELENMLSKNEILALYVNIINYGDGNIGINKASYGYFGYSPAELTDGEAALLAGIPQNPTYYQLSDHAANAKQKQAVVLESMVRNKKISQEEADSIYQETLYYQANGQWNQLYAAAEPALQTGNCLSQPVLA